jgi:hypothetical protein
MARKISLVAVLVAAWVVVPAAAQAAPVTLCVPSGPDAAVTTLKADTTCPAGKTKTPLASDADLAAAKNRIATLEALLAGVTRSSSGGVTTLKFSGMNVQVVSGSGKTDGAVNGNGNLIIGYDEAASGAKRTGSHNLVLGRGQSFSSWGAVLAGEHNASSAHGSLLAGSGNTGSGADASVTGGTGNRAGQPYSSVTGGVSNFATVRYGSVTGGGCNTAGPGEIRGSDTCNFPNTGDFAAVTGGVYNLAQAAGGSITGGGVNKTTGGSNGSITGGQFNTVSGPYAAIAGGAHNRASSVWSVVAGGACGIAGLGAHDDSQDCNPSGGKDGWFAAVAGGERNVASAFGAVVSGGHGNTADGREAAISGGEFGSAPGTTASISGGGNNHANGADSSILGGSVRTTVGNFETYPAGP